MSVDTKLGPEEIAELKAADADLSAYELRPIVYYNDGAWVCVAYERSRNEVANQKVAKAAVKLLLHRKALIAAAERCGEVETLVRTMHARVARGYHGTEMNLSCIGDAVFCARQELHEETQRLVASDAALTEMTADRDALAAKLAEVEGRAKRAEAALLALKKWDDEYGDLVERSKRWVHDSTMWETSSYPELAKEWQALWSRYPESVIDINTTPPADGSGEGA